jgi:hypothetical protein
MTSGVCAAQQSAQFNATPYVQSTYGRVTSILSGTFQSKSNALGPDILYINAPTMAAASTGAVFPTIVAGALINDPPSFLKADADAIPFTNVSNVVAALGDFDNDGKVDFAFALSPLPGAIPGGNYICVYYGTGENSNNNNFSHNGVSSYDGGNAYPPMNGKSGCMTFTVHPGGITPNFAYIAALPFTTNGVPQLLVEDSANNYLYVFSNNGQFGGTLPGFSLMSPPIPLTGGAGPIYYGDFNNDGNTDFIINGQNSHTATVYTGDGKGGFAPSAPYHFANGVYSMLLQLMEGDTQPSMVVEGIDGSITIHRGNPDGTFATPSEGGTATNANALSGNGGHLVAIGKLGNDTYNDILTSTPIGLSVLQGQDPINGSLAYKLRNIYNIGPGHSSFALAPFYGGSPALAVDSAEGVAFIQEDPNGDGGFQTSLAYSALAPALGATVGQFRSSGNPPDVVVATGTGASSVQARLLEGNGNGAFTAYPNPTNTTGPPSGIAANLWPNILSGDFNGNGVADLAYSLTGNPLPTTGSGLYVQYGVGDGTFASPVAVSAGQPGGNNFYGESTVGLFDKSGNAGIANIDAHYDDTLLGLTNGMSTGVPFSLGQNLPVTGNTNFNQVAAGYIKTGTSYQDLVFQNGTSLIPYKNNGDGKGTTFTPEPALTVTLSATNYAISAVLLTDIDGDGKGDILALYHNLASIPSDPSDSLPNWLYIWWGDGTGNFVQSTPIQLSRNYYLAAVGDMNAQTDMNGDTLSDIVLSDGYVVSILYNQGALGTPPNRSFGPETPFLAGQGINSLTLESVRGGKVPDLVVANGGATISNPIVLGGVAQTSATLPANPADINTGGITVLLNNITALPTTGTLAALPEPSNIGAAFTITATLTPSSGKTPTGPVTFYIDNTTTPVCTVALTASTGTTSTAQCIVPIGNSYGGGVHPMTAVYGGDPNNAVTTLTGTHNILDVATTTVLALCIGGSAPNCPVVGAPIGTLPVVSPLFMVYGGVYNGTETILDNDGSAFAGTGTLDFYQDGVVLCTLQASSTIPCNANVGTGTPAGTHVYISEYSGDGTYGPSTSAPVTITVTPDTPTATVTSSLNPAPSGQSVTLTATLLGANAPLGTTASPVGLYVPPRGSVVFMNGSTLICGPSVALAPSSTGVSSTATCTTSTLPVGADSITASYAAGQDIDFIGATSAAFTETITKVNTTDFTVSATPNPANAGVGYAALLTVTVAVNNGFAEGVNLTCGNLPTEATCTFAPAATPGGGGTSTLIVETTAPHTCGTTQPYFLGGNGGGPHLAPFALPALAGLVAFLIPGKRRWLRSLMALIVVAAITQISGCSTCTDLGTKPATYTFQVIGTSAMTGEVQSQTVTLNITI